MTPSALLTAFKAHNWMPALVMMSLLVRTWLTDKSKFPLTLPPNWQPVVVAAAAGFVNAVATAQAGAPPSMVIGSTMAWMASTGFLDGVLAAMWGDTKKAPWWGRYIVMAFDSTHGSSGDFKTTKTEEVPFTPTPVPPKPIINELRLLGAILIGACVGCAPTGYPNPVDIAQYAQAQNACVDTSGTRDEANDCRAAVRAQWCVKWPAAENCAGIADAAVVADGGAHE